MHESHIQRTAAALSAARSFVAPMVNVADAAAALLVAGGKLWLSGAPGPAMELLGRAGGFMAAHFLREEPIGEGDVVLHFHEAGKAPREGGMTIVFTADKATTGRHGFVWRDRSVSDTLGQVILGWLFTGELVAALTRLSRMPVMYQSIGMYEGVRRIETYKKGEVAFHEDRKVPAVEPEVLSTRFIEIVHDMLKRVEKQKRVKLDRAGAWARASAAAGGTLFMYTMGHGVPREVSDTAIGKVFTTGAWNAGFISHARPDHQFAAADLAVHVGYQHPPDDLFRRARSVGAKVVYVCLRPDRDVSGDDGVIWIDPMWDWPDACVPLEGYDVPILPASGIVNAAIAWELHRLATTVG